LYGPKHPFHLSSLDPLTFGTQKSGYRQPSVVQGVRAPDRTRRIPPTGSNRRRAPSRQVLAFTPRCCFIAGGTTHERVVSLHKGISCELFHAAGHPSVRRLPRKHWPPLIGSQGAHPHAELGRSPRCCSVGDTGLMASRCRSSSPPLVQPRCRVATPSASMSFCRWFGPLVWPRCCVTRVEMLEATRHGRQRGARHSHT
jgi:hypothetical protein